MCLCIDGDAKLHITGTHPRTYQSLQKIYKLAYGLRSLRIELMWLQTSRCIVCFPLIVTLGSLEVRKSAIIIITRLTEQFISSKLRSYMVLSA
jgi:hypothetical protein